VFINCSISCCSTNGYYYPGDQICPKEKKCLIHVLTKIPNKRKKTGKVCGFLILVFFASTRTRKHPLPLSNSGHPFSAVPRAAGTSLVMTDCVLASGIRALGPASSSADA